MLKKLEIGIDFGNTCSTMAYWDIKENKAKIIPNSDGENSTPTVVAFTETECLFGAAALEQAYDNPENTIVNVKRLLGKSITEPGVVEWIKALPYRVEAGP